MPAATTEEMNAQFTPDAVYNATLGYWTVNCDAKAPFAALIIGGKPMPMDPQDMIVRSLDGLPGYEDVCFSAFADSGGPPGVHCALFGRYGRGVMLLPMIRGGLKREIKYPRLRCKDTVGFC